MKKSWLAIAALASMGLVVGANAEEKSRVQVLSAPEKGPEPSALPFHLNLDELLSQNRLYRDVIYTGRLSQLALMSIPPGDHIGYEKHDHVEQLLFIQGGSGRLTIDGTDRDVTTGDVVVIPQGVPHDIVNTGHEPLQLFTVYTPPNHIAGREHPTREAAEADEEDEEFGRQVGQPRR